MIVIDTNIWIDHFRGSDPRIAALMTEGSIAQHAFVTGELAMGDLRMRDQTLLMLQSLAQVIPADEKVIYDIINNMQLVGTGLGFVDIHLLAALRESPDLRLWTRDNRLAAQAERLGQNYST